MQHTGLRRCQLQLAAMQVASALIKLNAPKSLAMAVIPMGTANDFASSIGLPEDPWEALQLCTMDTAQSIDVGIVNDKVPQCVYCLAERIHML